MSPTLYKSKPREKIQKTERSKAEPEIQDKSVQKFAGPMNFEIMATEDEDGKIWFPATNTAKKLGYKDPDKAVRENCNPKGGQKKFLNKMFAQSRSFMGGSSKQQGEPGKVASATARR